VQSEARAQVEVTSGQTHLQGLKSHLWFQQAVSAIFQTLLSLVKIKKNVNFLYIIKRLSDATFGLGNRKKSNLSNMMTFAFIVNDFLSQQ
jgi:hypothetical protein